MEGAGSKAGRTFISCAFAEETLTLTPLAGRLWLSNFHSSRILLSNAYDHVFTSTMSKRCVDCNQQGPPCGMASRIQAL